MNFNAHTAFGNYSAFKLLIIVETKTFIISFVSLLNVRRGDKELHFPQQINNELNAKNE